MDNLRVLTADKWNKRVGHPMQSFEWGEFRERVGNRVSRIIGDNQYQIIWTRIRPFNLWFGYCPMSPAPTEGDLKKIRDLGGVGVRFEPNTVLSTKDEVLRNLVPGRHLFKPKTYWVDLTQNEDELLKRMHPKCRYNIRLAKKHGIKIVEGDVESYLELMFEKTTRRQKIYAHSEKYHRRLAELDFVRLFKAEKENRIVASWMIFAWKDFVYYAYGAFDDEYKNTMAPVLGMWEIMKWGKANGYKTLDLWGAEEGKGFSRFKEQFGPKLVEMAGTWDLSINPLLYKLFRIAEETRWKILRILK